MEWEKIKVGLIGAAGGAIALAIVGFNWGGWVTTGSAQAMAKEVAANAVAERLGAICSWGQTSTTQLSSKFLG